MPENRREVAERVSNFSEWGDSDQIGTLNYPVTTPVPSSPALNLLQAVEVA
jgi:hypothetical protein